MGLVPACESCCSCIQKRISFAGQGALRPALEALYLFSDPQPQQNHCELYAACLVISLRL